MFNELTNIALAQIACAAWINKLGLRTATGKNSCAAVPDAAATCSAPFTAGGQPSGTWRLKDCRNPLKHTAASRPTPHRQLRYGFGSKYVGPSPRGEAMPASRVKTRVVGCSTPQSSRILFPRRLARPSYPAIRKYPYLWVRYQCYSVPAK